MGNGETTGRRRVFAATATALAVGATALRATTGSAGGSAKARQVKAMRRELRRMAPDIRETRAIAKRIAQIRGMEDIGNHLVGVAERIEAQRQAALDS